MSSEVVVHAEAVGKAYAMFARPEHRLKQMLFGRWRTYYEHFWALQAINLEIRQGETWGIIGRNGSGKSTLLQMVCGNLTPTVGTLTVRGRIAALLELGAGFNPEFTGRENVYTSGIIAGYNRDAVDDRLDSILAFADIGGFIDQPVKTYSSGMFARLAFAVAISVEPDILIVDEALAVGDEAFQRKCFARMERIKSNGATILFVSHATGSVIELCDHAILLHQGEHLYTGRPKRAVAWYQKLMAAPAELAPAILAEIRLASPIEETGNDEPGGSALGQSSNETPMADAALLEVGAPAPVTTDAESETAYFDPALESGSTLGFASNGAEISNAQLLTVSGIPVNCLVPGERYVFCYRVTFTEAAQSVKFHCMTKTVNGVHLGGGTMPPGMNTVPAIPAGQIVDVRFEFACAFGRATYFMNCGVAARGEILHRVLDVLPFRVGRGPLRCSTGTIDLDVRGEIRPAGSTINLAGD